MYDVKSLKAEEFINDEEILESLAYASANKSNRELIEEILKKAETMQGISHREAAVLLECDLPDITERIYTLAKQIKDRFYGNRIVMFAPLYLSNYCVNGCVYCPYHYKNKNIARKKLTQEEVRKEVIALQDMGLQDAYASAGICVAFNIVLIILMMAGFQKVFTYHAICIKVCGRKRFINAAVFVNRLLGIGEGCITQL